MAAAVEVDADYLVVGAGAMGMAFVDALVGHSDATVAIVDRRHAPGGHWLDAYPFVQLHQASAFYGVASTLLGGGRIQVEGPEAGLHERASAAEICAYYAEVLEQLMGTGRVTFHPGCEYTGERNFRSRISGVGYAAPRARLVDAAYLAGDIPATTPPPFAVQDGANVIPVNDLVRVTEPPDRYVIVGAGKTSVDACVWLLQNGVDPDAICWVRPREAWMLDRAVVQPNPAVFTGMAADTMEAAAEAASADDLFLRLEERGIMVRIDTTVTPTMAKTPTLGRWELDLVRQVTDVVRRGHVRAVSPGRLTFDDGDVRISPNAVVVHCAASGLGSPPLVPIWQPDAIRPRPAARIGFPCFGAALTGYMEATREDDGEKNDACRPSPYANTPADWLTMQVIGGDAARAMSRHPDLREFANATTLNPSRIPPDLGDDPAVAAAIARLKAAVGAGRARMAELADADAA
ncbi:pyridine nucleotide-disulfide oxidoreductase [Agromyces sp. SYSU T0242]|uniref:pyridine nucleotide-disulfide oxidoreductase n=1 Tax=Agromyces litoreus TaxID=3158561 RepID=UPI003395FC4B